MKKRGASNLTIRERGRQTARNVVSLNEMAAMVGLSRSRFYALVKAGTFPPPVYPMLVYRAVYPPFLQRVCLDVRRNGRGVNGQPVRFANPMKLVKASRSR